ncbi:MAG TPA: DUF5700 domain-containing putative Zn-dependent protease, partial [Pyrinomonadaceae bacterium]|nr:DUF5700 domain-containing putative Zn-dependent protease [Pyrinomonadaceae bacterium]
WKMAVVIEKRYGRKRLIECLCDQRKLLSTYNSAAAKYNRSARVPLALWSSSLIQALSQANKQNLTPPATDRGDDTRSRPSLFNHSSLPAFDC